MTLVVFDIDGTLLDSNQIDADCYLAALQAHPGIGEISTDWSTYTHVTDAYVTVRIFEDHIGRAPTDEEWAEAQARMVANLDQAHAAGEPVDPIAGVREALAALEAEGIPYAVATGAWEVSARWKLRASGLDLDGAPSAYSEDGPSRETIVQAAIDRASSVHDRTFERVVSVGDGVWDVTTARTLGVPFIGIAEGRRAERLRAAGAETVLAHYEPTERFLEAVASARVP